MAPNQTLILGVDPGLTGAVSAVLLDSVGNPLLMGVADMPVATVSTNGSAKNHLILPQLAREIEILRGFWPEHAVAVFIEQVNAMPGQGVTSMFRFGYAAGAVEGVVAGLGYPVHKIFPKQWQAIARVQKDPDAGRLRASQIFPAQAGLFSRKKDHNRADAALIGYAGAITLRNLTP